MAMRQAMLALAPPLLACCAAYLEGLAFIFHAEATHGRPFEEAVERYAQKLQVHNSLGIGPCLLACFVCLCVCVRFLHVSALFVDRSPALPSFCSQGQARAHVGDTGATAQAVAGAAPFQPVAPASLHIPRPPPARRAGPRRMQETRMPSPWRQRPCATCSRGELRGQAPAEQQHNPPHRPGLGLPL